MIVEFIGESGCGKTTVANKVISLMPGSQGKRGLTCKDNLACLFKVLGNKKTSKAYRTLVKLKFSVNGFSRFFKDMLYAAGVFNYLLLGSDDNVLYIIDQGTVQLIRTIYYKESIKDDRYGSYLNELFADNDLYVVVCKCSREILLNRIHTRGADSREIPRRIENAEEELFDVHERNLDKVVSRIPEDRYILVDTQEDPEANAKLVSEFIRSRRVAV